MSQGTLPWRPILGSKSAKSAYSPTFVALAFRHGVEYRNLHLIALFGVFSGRQPYRTGLYGPTSVVLPFHGVGLPHDEVTIAEALRDHAGYSTGIVGKWHLGGCGQAYYLGYIYYHFAPTASLCLNTNCYCLCYC